MKEKYLKPSAEEVLFDINNVNMEITLLSVQDGGESNLLSDIGNGLVAEE